MKSLFPPLLRFVSVAAISAGLAACAAVYPELATRTRPLPANAPLDPPPPNDLRWVRFVSARVPEKTRDGRQWQASGKANPYAKLLVNGKEVLKTPPQIGTLEPTWPSGPRGNFRLAPEDRLRVEIWDSNPISDAPIGVKELGRLGDLSPFEGQLPITFGDGAEAVLALGPAHAMQGLGLWFELRTAGCAITRTLAGSPADRAGLKANDEVLKIGTRDVKAMSSGEVQSAFNAVPFEGLALTVQHAGGGAVEALTVKEGPIYPLFEQFGQVD